MCDKAPAALYSKNAVGHLNPRNASQYFENAHLEIESVVGGDPLLILASLGENDPRSLSSYEKTGGYSTLRRLINIEPVDIISRRSVE